MTITFFSHIAISSIRPASVVQLDNGFGTIVKLTMGDAKEAVRFQAPLMRLAWDVNISDKFGPPSCVLPLCLDPEDGFTAWMKGLRDYIKGLCVENSAAWYGKVLSEAQVEEYLGEITRVAKDSRYSDLFVPKVPLRKDEINNTCEMNLRTFTADRVKYQGNPAEVLTKNAKCIAEISVPYIFFGKGTKSITVKCEVVSALVFPTPPEEECQFDMNAQPVLQQIVAAVDKRKADEASDASNGPEASSDGDSTSGDAGGGAGVRAPAFSPAESPKRARLDYDVGSDDDV
ncbi:hypothetical protein JKP88DRAFT_264304 [Tribonema minus]|uniref:Uncharacterized protein n=1 Tax=Tribonema minus TaxID=303371 RepID=A0A835YSJ2_9STRA|nr:hypothetical protein JKP88DRAFT_264304 [Tribonema minus]